MYYIIYSSEVVVYDKTGKRVVATATEQEALEYIAEQEEYTDGDS